MSPCSTNCNNPQCSFYHSLEERRRSPFVLDHLAYLPQYCTTMYSCPNGDQCNYFHNKFEMMFHPGIYKTSMCEENCTRGYYCPFAHSEKELRKQERLTLYHMTNEPSKSFLPPQLSPFMTPETTLSGQEKPELWNHLDLNTFKTQP